MTLSICEAAHVAVFEPSDKLRAAKEASDAAKDAYDVALERLHAAMAEELIARPDIGTTEMAGYLDYSAGHTRRLARERGVPARIEAEPPRRRKREPEEPHD
jgi:hypothetical protein